MTETGLFSHTHLLEPALKTKNKPDSRFAAVIVSRLIVN